MSDEETRSLAEPWWEQLQAWIDDLLESRDVPLDPHQHVRVLEAGCGSMSHVRFGPNANVVGIDISKAQLARNQAVHTKILGDVQTYRFEPSSFDIIVCCDVLEHLPNPRAALTNFARALKPGGYIALSFPEPLSVKGLVTKLTPYSFHIWFYRRVLGRRDAGTEDTAPFPTPLRMILTPRRLRKFVGPLGLRIVRFHQFESQVQVSLRQRLGLVGWRWQFLRHIVRLFSLGQIHASSTEVAMILAKEQDRSGKVAPTAV